MRRASAPFDLRYVAVRPKGVSYHNCNEAHASLLWPHCSYLSHPSYVSHILDSNSKHLSFSFSPSTPPPPSAIDVAAVRIYLFVPFIQTDDWCYFLYKRHSSYSGQCSYFLALISLRFSSSFQWEGFCQCYFLYRRAQNRNFKHW